MTYYDVLEIKVAMGKEWAYKYEQGLSFKEACALADSLNASKDGSKYVVTENYYNED